MPDLKKFGEKATEQVRLAFHRKDRAAEQNHGQVVPTAISARNAVKVIYFLMAADGEVYHGEEEKFDAIGADLISNFDEMKASILAECQADMRKVIDPEDHYDVIPVSYTHLDVYKRQNFFRCSGHGRTSKPLRPLSACPSSVLQWPNQATALPQVSKRLEKRFSHHYYVYQGSVRLNSAFKGKRVEEMAAMR